MTLMGATRSLLAAACGVLVMLTPALPTPALPTPATAVHASGSSQFTAAPQAFVLPAPPPPRILTSFSAPPTRYGAGHRGVDLAAAVGARVLAAGSGVVVFAGVLAGRGVISVQHAGGLRTTYEPVAAQVRAGDLVTSGQPIGTVQGGHPACSPASCLHWGARLPDRVYLDPMSLLRRWEVRLLPWGGR